MEIGRKLPKQPFSTGSGRITLRECQRDYFRLFKSPDFRLYALRCAGSYLQVFIVFELKIPQSHCLSIPQI